MVREELEKYDGGFTDEWNDQREKNAEVLGYKLSGKSDIKEGWWEDLSDKAQASYIKKHGAAPNSSGKKDDIGSHITKAIAKDKKGQDKRKKLNRDWDAKASTASDIAKDMSGNMTGAVKKIEKIKKGLSNDPKVKAALRKANESINESDLGLTYKKGKTVKVTHKKSGKELVIIDKPNVRKEYEKIGFYVESINEKMGPEQYHKYMQYVFDTQFKTPEEKKMKKSIIKKINKGQKKKGLPLFKESVNEGKFGKFDTGAAFKGNGLTIYDRNQSQGGDFKNIAHISEDGKITIWDKNIKKEHKLIQALKKISNGFKASFKESVNESRGISISEKGMVFFLDQLVNSMEHYDEREFVRGLGKKLGIDSKVMKRIWKNYDKVHASFRDKWTDRHWERWLNKQGITEDTKRDYKAEYKKYGSSTKAKKYRAELNQYNRKKGTYGNNDGKDASHKGGKIVGFEKESTNRGRREKSRLKKEEIFKLRQMIKEELQNSQGEQTDFKKGDLVKDINPDCPHHGSEGEVTKVGKGTITFDVSNNGKNYQQGDELEKTVDQMVKLKESVNESRYNVKKAIKIAKKMGGNMTGAVKKIEKIQKGLSKQIEVEDALRKANESVNEAVEPAGNMAKIQKIVSRKQATKLGGVMIDMQSASLLMKLWDAVSDKDKEKMNKLNPKVLTTVIKKLWSRVNLKLPM
jgi:flagellar hook-basal body complex protein FliE